jgi:phenylacetate-CoA ligase
MTKKFLKYYYKFPILFQNIAISIFGYIWNKRRYGGVFQQEYINAKEREYFSFKQWDDYQLGLLRKLLIHSLNTVPYYRNLFQKLGYTEEMLQHFELAQIKSLPFLEKDTFRQLGETDLVSEKREPKGAFFSSSGSTGTPVKILYSHRMHQAYFSIFEARIYNWTNITHKDSRGMIGGRRIIQDGLGSPPYYRYNIFEKQVYFSAYHISPSTVHDYIKGMQKYKSSFMTGYASSNYFLARFIEEQGLVAPKMKAVLSSSEKLTQEMRDTFKRVYGCKTHDSYNGVECCNLISECEHGKLHIVPDVGIVEIVDENGNECKPGEIGEIISTGLLNFDQPLIRYRMGDLVKLSLNQTCECNRSMYIVDEIVGRVEDTIIGVDGREMVRFHGIFIDIHEIKQAQVIQNSIHDFQLNIVVTKPLTVEDIESIKNRMYSQLTKDITIEIKFVDHIELTSNGKFKAVISNVKRASIQKI